MSEEKENLKIKVLDFVKTQPGYSSAKHAKLRGFCEDKDIYMVVYGETLWDGIGGLGATPELAYNDFVRSWSHLRGFEWIENNKQADDRR